MRRGVRKHNINLTIDPRLIEFKRHLEVARSRGIPFELEFWEWLQIWEESGHFHERGRRKGQYVMARHGDVGPYKAGNVKIIPVETNTLDGNRRGSKRHRLAKGGKHGHHGQHERRAQDTSRRV